MSLERNTTRRMIVGSLLIVLAGGACAFESPSVPDAQLELNIVPEFVTLGPLDQLQFEVVTKARDGQPSRVGLRAQLGSAYTETEGPPLAWSASGGVLSETGRYAASDQPGEYLVIVTSSSGVLSDTAIVMVTDQAVAPVSSVSVSPATADVFRGSSFQMTVELRDETGNTLTGRPVAWTSSDTDVATVSGSGLVLGVAEGSAEITAASGSASGTATVTVSAVPAASVSVSPPTATLTVDDAILLTAEVRDADDNVMTDRAVSWSSDDDAVATVDGAGRVTGVGAGTARISATDGSVSGDATITVEAGPDGAVASVQVLPSAMTIPVGGNVRLDAETRDAVGSLLVDRNVSWSSDNPSVAAVESDGLVTGVGLGSTTITATSEGKSGSATITVSQAPPPPPPPGTGVYPNQPVGYAPIAEHAFSGGLIAANGRHVTTKANGLIRGGWTIHDKAGLSIVPDDEYDGILRSTFPVGLNPGSGTVNGVKQWNLQLWDESGTTFAKARQMQKLYMAAWIRIADARGFAMPGAQQKLFNFGVATTNGSKVDARLMILNTAGNHNRQKTFRLEVNNQSVPASMQVDHGKGGAQSGQSQLPNTENAGHAMVAGQWHLVETVMELNNIGQQNGVWHVWIDGVQVHRRTDWVHRTAGSPNGFYVWKWDPTWGGGGSGTRRVEDYIDVAHVYLSGVPKP